MINSVTKKNDDNVVEFIQLLNYINYKARLIKYLGNTIGNSWI